MAVWQSQKSKKENHPSSVPHGSLLKWWKYGLTRYPVLFVWWERLIGTDISSTIFQKKRTQLWPYRTLIDWLEYCILPSSNFIHLKPLDFGYIYATQTISVCYHGFKCYCHSRYRPYGMRMLRWSPGSDSSFLWIQNDFEFFSPFFLFLMTNFNSALVGESMVGWWTQEDGSGAIQVVSLEPKGPGLDAPPILRFWGTADAVDAVDVVEDKVLLGTFVDPPRFSRELI